MATEILQKVGSQIRFCVSGSFSPADNGTNWTIGTPTNVAMTCASLANGSARQSAKCDLGATRAAAYQVLAAVDFTGETPSATGYFEYYWAPSTSSTTGDGNVAGNSGNDAACPDGALGSITLAEFLKQCQFIGTLQCHDGAVVQNGLVGVFSPNSRYGQLIAYNVSGDVLENDDVENHVVFNPIVDEAQTA